MAPGILSESFVHGVSTWEKPTYILTTTQSGFITPRWPQFLSGSLAWKGSQFTTDSDYLLTLSSQEKEEINKALEEFKFIGIDGHEISRDNFVLPTLGPKLSACALDLHDGKGFVNIRGLEPGDYSVEDNVALFLGISSYIGEKRAKQDEDGNMLMHICDDKITKEPQQARPIRYSNLASTYHTDTFADIIALHTRGNAAMGGSHLIASSWQIYNEIAAKRPDLLEVMARADWPFDSRGKLFEANCRPLMFYHGGRLILNFAQEPLRGLRDVQRPASFPELSAKQSEVLDLIESIANDNKLTLDTQLGDMVLINNHALLHSREAFEDIGDAKRHVVRLWLKKKSLAWKLPNEIQFGNSRIYDDNELEPQWNIAPTPRLNFKLSERLCS